MYFAHQKSIKTFHHAFCSPKVWRLCVIHIKKIWNQQQQQQQKKNEGNSVRKTVKKNSTTFNEDWDRR